MALYCFKPSFASVQSEFVKYVCAASFGMLMFRVREKEGRTDGRENEVFHVKHFRLQDFSIGFLRKSKCFAKIGKACKHVPQCT